MEAEITHKEIYERLVQLEGKVDIIVTDTAAVVSAFKAAQGAFAALEFLGKLAKPLLWIAAACAAAGVLWSNVKLK